MKNLNELNNSDLIDKLDQYIQEDFFRDLSDNFYYTNGKRTEVHNKINSVKNEMQNRGMNYNFYYKRSKQKMKDYMSNL